MHPVCRPLCLDDMARTSARSPFAARPAVSTELAKNSTTPCRSFTIMFPLLKSLDQGEIGKGNLRLHGEAELLLDDG